MLVTLDDARHYLTAQAIPTDEAEQQILATAIKAVTGRAERDGFHPARAHGGLALGYIGTPRRRTSIARQSPPIVGKTQVEEGPMTETKDAFDQWWEWASKPPESMLTIPAEIHNAVMMLTEEERKDRAIVNETVRTGTHAATAGRDGRSI